MNRSAALFASRSKGVPFVPISSVVLHSMGNGFSVFADVHFSNPTLTDLYCGYDGGLTMKPQEVVRDDERAGYDRRGCGPSFLIERGKKWKRLVLQSFQEKLGEKDSVTIVSDGDINTDVSEDEAGVKVSDGAVRTTLEAILQRKDLIINPALKSEKLRLWGVPPAIVRRGALSSLCELVPSFEGDDDDDDDDDDYHPLIIKPSIVTVEKTGHVNWSAHQESVVGGSLYKLVVDEMIDEMTSRGAVEGEMKRKRKRKEMRGVSFLVGMGVREGGGGRNRSEDDKKGSSDESVKVSHRDKLRHFYCHDHRFGTMVGIRPGLITPPSVSESAALAAPTDTAAVDAPANTTTAEDRLSTILSNSLAFCRLTYDVPSSRKWRLHPSDKVMWPLLFSGRKSDRCFPWVGLRKDVMKKWDDVSQVTNIGTKERDHARTAHGIMTRKELMARTDSRYGDLTVSEALGLRSPKSHKAILINSVLDANRPIDDSAAGDSVTHDDVGFFLPESLLGKGQCAFYVDFETVTSIRDEFEYFPRRSKKSDLIFMIGCGVVWEGEWVDFQCHIADRLDGDSERDVINKWGEGMRDARAKYEGLDYSLDSPNLIVHYSSAEKVFLKSALKRHPPSSLHLPPLRWFDLYSDVFLRPKKSSLGHGCFAVRGSWGFGLKKIATALHSDGRIETSWPNTEMDGMAANVGTLWCDKEAKRRGCRMVDLDGGEELSDFPENVTEVGNNLSNLMREIESYNKVDCRVMFEIVDYYSRKTASRVDNKS